ncbi:hypothetical protein [Actinoplanes sp. NPDC026619]|uniref:hypothetical protein n=1 Tax=Actinoplanes sp. NPDC026619 TaxID=3155798 RepID=UPI0033E93CE8
MDAVKAADVRGSGRPGGDAAGITAGSRGDVVQVCTEATGDTRDAEQGAQVVEGVILWP